MPPFVRKFVTKRRDGSPPGVSKGRERQGSDYPHLFDGILGKMHDIR